jgi:hypothetical protein
VLGGLCHLARAARDHSAGDERDDVDVRPSWRTELRRTPLERRTLRCMGLKLRVSLFRGARASDVRAALERFWRARGAELSPVRDDFERYDLHEASKGYCALAWDSGWEWVERRAAHAAVARELACAALFVFVYDGDYWGYELADARGAVVDQFVQSDLELTGVDWFPGRDTRGQARVLAQTLEVPEADVAPYLRQTTLAESEERDLDEQPVRAGDLYGRESELAVIDFLRAAGVDVGLRARPRDEKRPWLSPGLSRHVTFGGDVVDRWTVTRDGRWVGRDRTAGRTT